MIGKAIANLLTTHAGLTAIVPSERIFPYVINENTALPAIIYSIDTLTSDYSKDGWVGDSFSFSVTTYSDDYLILQNIVREVRDAMELWKGTTQGITLGRIELGGMLEGFNLAEGVFVNKLTFNVYITGI